MLLNFYSWVLNHCLMSHIYKSTHGSLALTWHEIACRCLWWSCDENVWPCMKFVGYKLFVHSLTMCRSYAHEREILWKMLHFDHGYVTCLYVPFYHVGDACAKIVAILLVYVWILSCYRALCIFEKNMLAFVDLIHALPTRGRNNTQFMFPGGVFAWREEKLGEMHLFMGSLHSCLWELFLAWMLVVLFCRWCRTLLPHLEESAILEHFISVVSSRCPCLRGPRFFLTQVIVSWLLLGFWSLFWVFSFISFLFIFSLNWLLVCCQCTHQCGDWGPEHLRTDGRSLLAVMSDWQHGVDWLLAKYCRCRLWLDLRWCRWRASVKCLCLVGPPRSGETSRLGLRDPVASGVECGPHGGKKIKTKSWTGAGAG
jgi:hypothetical protein